MTDLEEGAKAMAVSANLYSVALCSMERTMLSESIARAITRDMDIERISSNFTDAIINDVRRLNAVSSNIQSLMPITSGMARLTESMSAADHVLKAFEDQKRQEDMIGRFGAIDSISALIARMDLPRILSAQFAAEPRFSNFVLGQIAGIDRGFREVLTSNFERMTQSYQSLMDSVAAYDSPLGGFPLIAACPQVEYYREVSVLESLTVREQGNVTNASLIDSAINETLPTIDNLLADLDGRLCKLLHGARLALQSNNPDRARHVTTSIRELFTSMFHILAPDDDVRKWTTSPELFDKNNRPTRRARLLFICRNINSDPLSQFVEDDVRAALSFVECLNAGTHCVVSKLTTAQLELIVLRAESLLRFLLQLRML